MKQSIVFKKPQARKEDGFVKKFMRMIALSCVFVLFAAMSAGAVQIDIQDDTMDGNAEAMRRAVLMDWDVDTGNDGTDETPSFEMVPGDGEYLRWYFKNNAWSGRAHVYLYDVNKGSIVSAMSPCVDPGEEQTEVYFVGSDSELCEFTIIVESVDSKKIYGTVRANQIYSD